MGNKTDKMGTAFIIQFPLYGWHLDRRKIILGKSGFYFFMLHYLSSLATSEEKSDREALKLADNKAIVVALFVIPSAISVHLHTFLLPLARRFI